jgi:hypothetical protein
VSLISGWIADGAAVVLAVVAFNEASEAGRLVILALMGAVFGMPYLWPSPAMSLACFLGKIVLAVGFSIYIKWVNRPSRF